MGNRDTAFRVHGIIPAMVTPFNKDEPDLDALRKLTRHLIAGGVHGLFPQGVRASSTP